MKLSLNAWFKPIFHGILELIFLLPVALLAAIRFAPEGRVWLWLGLLAAAVIGGVLFQRLLSASYNWLRVLFSIAIAVIAAYPAFGVSTAAFIFSIFAIACAYRGMMLVHSQIDAAAATQVYWVGLILYFLTYLFFERVDILKPYALTVNLTGMGCLIWTIFSMNLSRLREESSSPKGRRKVDAAMLRKNQLLVTGVLAFIFLVGGFGILRRWLAQAAESLFAAIAYLLKKLAPHNQTPQEPPLKQNDIPPLPKADEPAKWIQILEKVIYWGVILFICAALIVLLIKVAPIIKRWLGRFFNKDREQETKFGYVDETDKLMTWKEWGMDLAKKAKSWLPDFLAREPKWHELAGNRDKARYLYRHFMLRRMAEGYDYKPEQTPAEAALQLAASAKLQPLPEQLVGLYNEARYGEKDRELNEAQLEALKQELDRDSNGGRRGEGGK